MLPSVRSLLIVDAEGFSRNRDAELPGLHTEIRRVVESACERSGLGDAWRAARFLQSTGDGLLIVLPLEAMTSLIHPFVDRLQDALTEARAPLRAQGLQLRLRVALHVGLVDDEHPVTAGISTATNEVCRLLDCEPLRAALRDSDPDVTHTAAIVSSEAFDMFVRGGHAGLEPSQFAQVRATVKQFDRPAFLYVATPSKLDRPDDATPPGGATPERRPFGPNGGMSFGNISVTGDGAQNVIGSQGGEIRQDRS